MSKDLQKLETEKIRAKNLKNYKEASEICNFKGEIYASSGDFDEALKEHKQELEFCKLSGDVLGKAVAYRRIGECYAELQQFDKALLKHTCFLHYAEEAKSTIEVQRAWATLGRTYFLQYNSDPGRNPIIICKAEEATLKALKYAERLKDCVKDEEYNQMVCRACLNVAHVYECKNDNKCVVYYERALILAKKHSFKEDLYRCQMSLGNYYQTCDEHVLAIQVLNNSIETARHLKDKIKLCDAYLSKAQSLLITSDYVGAKYCFKKAYSVKSPSIKDHKRAWKSSKLLSSILKLLKDLNETTDKEKQLVFCDQIADNFVELKCYNAAIQYYQKELEYAVQLKKPEAVLATIHVSLGQTYLDYRQYMTALHHFQTEQKLRKGNLQEVIQSALKIIEIKILLGTEINEVISDYDEVLVKCGDDFKLRKIVLSDYAVYLKDVDHPQLSRVEEMLDGLQNVRIVETVGCDEDEDDDSNVDNLSELSALSNDSESDVEERLCGGPRNRKRVKLTRNERGETPLHTACIKGDYKQVQQLIEKGHPVNERDNCGWLPIHEASNHGRADIVEYLIDHGAHLNDSGGKFCDGTTPLHDACVNGHFDVISVLIRKRANVTCRDHYGNTALDNLRNFKNRSDLSPREEKEYLQVEAKLVEAMKLVNFDFNQQKRTTQKRPASFTKNAKRNRAARVDIDGYLSEPDTDNPVVFDENPYVNEYANAMETLRRKPSSKEFNERQSLIPESTPALLNESELNSDDWLIDDTRKARFNRLKSAPQPVKKSKGPSQVERENQSFSDDHEYLYSNEDLSYSNILEKSPLHEVNSERLDFIPGPDVSAIVPNEPDTRDSDHNRNASCSKYSAKSRKNSLLIRVNIENDVFLIHIPEKNATVGLLSDAVSDRYYTLKQVKPKVSIRTKDNALLSATDLIADVVVDDGDLTVNASVESVETQPLISRYCDQCRFANVKPSRVLMKKLQDADDTGLLELAHIVINRKQLQSLVNCLKQQETINNVTIAFSNIVLIDTTNEFLKNIFKLPQIRTLDVQGTGITLSKFDRLSGIKSPVQEINMSYNFFEKVTFSCLKNLLLNCSSLEVLNLLGSGVPRAVIEEVTTLKPALTVITDL